MYRYIKEDLFTSEIFKVEIQNLPKYIGFNDVKKFLAKDFKDPEPNTEAAVRAPGAGTAEHAERQGLEPSRAPSDSCLQRGGRSAAPR